MQESVCDYVEMGLKAIFKPTSSLEINEEFGDICALGEIQLLTQTMARTFHTTHRKACKLSHFLSCHIQA